MKNFFLLFFLFILIGCEEEKVKPNINTNFSTEELPDQESWNSTIVFTDSGKTKAIMEAGHLRVYSSLQETLIDSGIKVDFFNELGIKSTTLTSVKGKVDDRTRDIYAIQNVVAKNDSGVVLKTEELIWRNNDQKIATDLPITITTPTEEIHGVGFESDQHLRNYIIYKITYVTTLSDTL